MPPTAIRNDATRHLLLVGALIAGGAASAAAAPIAVHGRVEAEGGGAVRDAVVRLYPMVGMREAGELQLAGTFPPPHKAEAKVDADGTFRIEAPSPGVWHLVAGALGRAPLAWTLQPLVEETWLPTAELAADAPLEVVVVDAAGKPVKGAAVIVEAANALSFAPGWLALPARIVTGANGKAVAPRRAKSRVDVIAAAPNGVVAKVTDVGGASARVTLAAGVRRELLVVDADGRPAAGAMVMSSPRHAPVVTTSAAGKAEVVAPAAAPLVVEVESRTGAHARVTIEPPPKGETPKPLRVVLQPDPPLAGRVIDAETRRPVAGAVVYVPAHGEAFAVSDGAGAFALERAPTGGMGRTVRVAAAGCVPAGAPPATAARRALTLALQPAAALVGSVTDAKGRPLAGVEVNAVPAAPRGSSNLVMRRVGVMRGPQQARTDERGRFRIAPVVKEVPHDVAFRRAGYAPLVRQVPPATREGLAELHVTLSAGARGVGRVTSLQGEAIAGATVKVVKQDERGGAMVMRFGERRKPDAESSSDSAGSFTLTDLPAGRFTLEATAPGFAGSKVPGIEVQANAGEVDLGTVKLAPGVPVEGRVVSLQGQPIEGAEVFVLEGSAAMMPQPRWALMGQEPAATTAADGFFSLHDHSAGQKVDLAARRSGYTVERVAGVTAPTEEPVVITLRPAPDIRGRIVDPDGDPVANAQLMVLVERAGGGMGFMSTIGNTTSGDDGRFAIEDVDPGTVKINVTAAGFLPFERAGVEVPAGKDVDGLELVLKPGAVVEGMVTTPDGLPAIGAGVRVLTEQRGGPMRMMGGGGETDGEGRYRLDGVEPGPRTLEATHDDFARVVADLEVRAGENQLDIRLGGGYEVSGRVVDSGGQPVGGATVSLASPGQMMGGGNRGAITDAAGGFHVAGVPDGTYEATASHTDFGDGRTTAPLTVAGAPLSGVTIELPAGTVVTGALRGLSLAELGRTRVHAYQPEQRAMFRRGTVSYDGRYRISGLSAGEWTVRAQLEEGGRQAQGRLVIAASGGEETLDLDFEGGLTLHGRVREDGRALDGAGVFVLGKSVPGMSNARTDQAGAYRVENLSPGSYDVEVWAPMSGLRKHQTVTIERDLELDVDLRSTRLSGRVLESGTGDPIAGASIRVEAVEEGNDRLPFSGDVTTDEGGRFSLSTGEGTWRLLTEKVGYARAETRVNVGGEPIDDVEIRLSPTQGVTLQVSRTPGAPPSSVLVAVLHPHGAPLFSESYGTGEGGRVRLSTVPPGTWEVLVRAADSGTERVVVTSPGPPVPVMLAPQATLVVVVPDLVDAAVVAKAEVTGRDGRPFAAVGWGAVRREFDVAYGRATITGLPAGTWEVSLVAPDGRRWRGSAVTTPGATATVELD